jgi:hypothetical protein
MSRSKSPPEKKASRGGTNADGGYTACSASRIECEAWHIKNDKEEYEGGKRRHNHTYATSQKTNHAFAKTFLTASLLCFFANMTPKRWKSFNFLRASTEASFFAQVDWLHFSAMLSASKRLRTTAEPAARGSFETVSGVRVRWR